MLAQTKPKTEQLVGQKRCHGGTIKDEKNNSEIVNILHQYLVPLDLCKIVMEYHDTCSLCQTVINNIHTKIDYVLHKHNTKNSNKMIASMFDDDDIKKCIGTGYEHNHYSASTFCENNYPEEDQHHHIEIIVQDDRELMIKYTYESYGIKHEHRKKQVYITIENFVKALVHGVTYHGDKLWNYRIDYSTSSCSNLGNTRYYDNENNIEINLGKQFGLKVEKMIKKRRCDSDSPCYNSTPEISFFFTN